MQGTVNEPARGRNCTTLARLHPVERVDRRISFDEKSHTYHVDGKRVPTSVTSVLKTVTNEETFDADGIISKNLPGWRRKPHSEYGRMICGLSDEDARVKIKHAWSDANRLGTQLHLQLEAAMNDEPCNACEEISVEWDMVTTALKTAMDANGWMPYRSEFSVFYETDSPNADVNHGMCVCAGQLDALFKDNRGEFVIVDLKRVKRPLEDVRPFGGRVCQKPLDKQWANEFVKYSLQQSLYCVMLEQQAGIVVDKANRFLLQAHPTMDAAQLVPCACFDSEARCILEGLATDC
jgi:hypothetical protein